MIVQFSVENFRSIKGEQTLSLVKNSASEMTDNYFSSNASSTPELLKTAVISGANASGKSNILKALRCMQWFLSHPKAAHLSGFWVMLHFVTPYHH